MSEAFQIHALSDKDFQSLFQLSDEALQAQNARRVTAEMKPGVPCRVSLEDAEIGEEVILLNYEHQSADSPFKSRHAIYVREGVQQKHLRAGEVPQLFKIRMMAARGFNAEGDMVDADVVDGSELDKTIAQMLENQDIDYVQLHYAKPGCFAATATRA